MLRGTGNLAWLWRVLTVAVALQSQFHIILWSYQAWFCPLWYFFRKIFSFIYMENWILKCHFLKSVNYFRLCGYFFKPFVGYGRVPQHLSMGSEETLNVSYIFCPGPHNLLCLVSLWLVYWTWHISQNDILYNYIAHFDPVLLYSQGICFHCSVIRVAENKYFCWDRFKKKEWLKIWWKFAIFWIELCREKQTDNNMMWPSRPIELAILGKVTPPHLHKLCSTYCWPLKHTFSLWLIKQHAVKIHEQWRYSFICS
jgi:hypothetical protein